MAEESKTSEKHEQQKIFLPNLHFDTMKAAPVRSAGSVPSSPTRLRRAASGRQNCLCSPTTHAGSFRCRYHRNTNLTRNSVSVGAKLSDLGEKPTEICGTLQARLIEGHNQAS